MFRNRKVDHQNKLDGGIELKFKYAEIGLYAFDKLEGFEIVGNNKVFYPANAKIVDRKNVFVKSGKVPNSVAVRYAWRNWTKGTLYIQIYCPLLHLELINGMIQ